MAGIVTRVVKGTPVSTTEMDNNLLYFKDNQFPPSASTADSGLTYTCSPLVAGEENGRVYGIIFSTACQANATLNIAGSARDIYYPTNGGNTFKVTAGAIGPGLHYLKYVTGVGFHLLNPMHYTYDLTSYAGSDYQLQIGESAKYTAPAASTSINLKLAVDINQRHELYPSFSFTVNTANLALKINNTTSTVYTWTTSLYRPSGPGTLTSYGYYQNGVGDFPLGVANRWTGVAHLGCFFNLTEVSYTETYDDGTNYGTVSAFYRSSLGATSLTSVYPSAGTFEGTLLITRTQ